MEKNKNKEIVVCTCSKSGCNKKYCECYKEGLKCNIKCRCINCLNMEEPLEKIDKDSNKIISLEETKSDSAKKTIKRPELIDNFQNSLKFEQNQIKNSSYERNIKRNNKTQIFLPNQNNKKKDFIDKFIKKMINNKNKNQYSKRN